ncbi:MAG: heme-binding protein [Pseudomonadota bacterium]
MRVTEPALRLTHEAALAMLAAAVAKAEEMGQPQCIAIVDASGVTVAQLRMTGAKYLSLKSARAKARTAASIGAPSGDIPAAVGPAIAAATGGAGTALAGGLPIFVERALVGGIGIGSGSPDQDVAVARAALAALS